MQAKYQVSGMLNIYGNHHNKTYYNKTLDFSHARNIILIERRGT